MIDTTRRSILAAAASIAAALPVAGAAAATAAAAASASEPDPMLVLIDRYRAACARRDVMGSRYGHLSLAEQKAIGADEQYAALDRPVDEIEREMVRTVPTSFAGLRAVLVLAAECEDVWCPLPKDEDERVLFYNNLIKAIDQLVQGDGPRVPTIARGAVDQHPLEPVAAEVG